MKLEEMFPSKKARVVIGLVCALFIAALIFAAGFYVGAEKEGFSRHWEENYVRNASGPRPFMGRVYVDRNFINPHGSAGTVLKIENNIITIKDLDGIEKNVVVTDDTTIRKGFTDVKIDAIKPNDSVVVIGHPNDKGEVEAQLIRITTR